MFPKAGFAGGDLPSAQREQKTRDDQVDNVKLRREKAQIWAQARQEVLPWFEAGADDLSAPWRLTPEEHAEQERINEEHATPDPLRDRVDEVVDEMIGKPDCGEVVITSDLLSKMHIPPAGREATVVSWKLSDSMRRKGWTPTIYRSPDGSRKRGYRRPPVETVDSEDR